ncbi:MAG: hypothetical protein QW667_04700 [Candidatus Bathyarchaeia archaeon]
MPPNPLKTLALVVSIYFFTNNLSGMFLTVYFRELGLSLAEIVEILLFTFLVIGLLPITLLHFVKNFEGIISFGILSTMLFYITLMFVRNPIILGLAYGLSTATFWPSFNLLQFRLSESTTRARTVSLFSSIIPSIASITGPAAGGFIIQNFGFASLFTVSIALYFVAFLVSMRVEFKPEIQKFSIPKARVFKIFFVTFIIFGLSEAYWIAYPLFVYGISGTPLSMGIVLALSSILISAVTFLVNWLSDVKMARAKFAIVGAILHATWYYTIANASSSYEIVGLSILSGLASAFSISWLAHYGDLFGKEYYASNLVMMEVGLMIGRIVNLAPTFIFLSNANYSSYFILLGIFSLLLIPLFILSQKTST